MDRWLNKIICGDCLEVMRDIPDKSVDLVLTDPPYNISKAEWDKWKRKEDYIEWMGQIFKECERLLKDNGSFYFFHNDMMQIKNLMQWLEDNTKFVFKQFIVWDKYHGSEWNQLKAILSAEGNRNYPKLAEYCLYYTFQDETGLTTVMLDTSNFPTIRGYFKGLQEYIGLSLKQINAGLEHRKAEHCFYWKTTQWDMPTPETYQELISEYCINQWEGFREYEDLRREYEDLRREYEDLRREYEDLRYTFNNQKTNMSVWQYGVVKPNGHITPKPVAMIENIIKHSSNESDIILDPFLGSGTTAIAAHNTGRFFIGIEKEPKYVEIARKRVEQAQAQQSLFGGDAL